MITPWLAALPAPVAAIPTPVPRNHGGWADQNQERAPILPDFREGYPRRSLAGFEPGPLLGSGVGRELLLKSEVLENEGATRKPRGGPRPGGTREGAWVGHLASAQNPHDFRRVRSYRGSRPDEELTRDNRLRRRLRPPGSVAGRYSLPACPKTLGRAPKGYNLDRRKPP
jgi:hypothetical protein